MDVGQNMNTPPAPNAAPAPEHNGIAILLAEDEAPVRKVLSRHLQRRGFQVYEAADGMEAVELYDTHAGQIHLILTDIMMPRLTGPEMIKQLKAKYGTLPPIIMSSGFSDNTNEVRDVDVSRFVSKPVSIDIILQAIRELVPA